MGERAQQILSSSASDVGSQLAQIARLLGLDIAELEHAFKGRLCAEPMRLRVKASTGFSVNAQMSLGWCDTQGYRMLGIGSKATAIASMGGNIFAGRHSSGKGIKIVLGVSNFTFESILPLALETDEASQPNQS